MTPDLPADLREAIALGIARGYYTHTCVEEIAPLISAALADAWQDGYEAGHSDARCVQASYPLETPNPYAPAERSGWEDHAPAEPTWDHEHEPVTDVRTNRPTEVCFTCCDVRHKPAAPSGVAPADTTESPLMADILRACPICWARVLVEDMPMHLDWHQRAEIIPTDPEGGGA